MSQKSYISSGYTLLELLVVLVIFSFLAAVTIPRLTNMYDSVQLAFERDEVFASLSQLGYLVFRQRRDFTLTVYPIPYEKLDSEVKPNQQPLLDLPEGWQIQAKTPILFRANGICNGGIIELKYQQQLFKLQLDPPFCQPKLITGK